MTEYPQIKFLEVDVRDLPMGVVTQAIDNANDFMFETDSENLPPQIVKKGETVYVPAYPSIADTLIRSLFSIRADDRTINQFRRAFETWNIEGFDVNAVIADAKEQFV